MKISCPHCGQHYEVSESALGQQASCDNCNKDFVIAAPVEVASNPPVPPSPESPTHCPFCGGNVVPGMKKCRHCGEWLDTSAKPQSPVIFVLLAMLLGRWGIHNFYTGAKFKGICKLIIEAVAAIQLVGFGAWLLFAYGSFYLAGFIVSSISNFVTLIFLLILWARSYSLPVGRMLRITFISVCALFVLAKMIFVPVFGHGISVFFANLMIPVSLLLTVDVWCVWEMFHCMEECEGAK